MKLLSFSFLLTATAIIGCTGSSDPAEKKVSDPVPLTLQQRLDTCPSDTDRFMVLGENVERFMYDGNKDSALYYLDLCRKEAEKTHNINLLERAEDVCMNVLMYTHDSTVLDQSIALVEQREKNGRPRPLGVAREILGGLYLRTEMFRSADSLMERAAEAARQAQDTTRWAAAVLGRVVANNKMGLKDKTLSLINMALMLADGSRDPDVPTSARIELATVFNDLGRADSSILLLNEAFAMASFRGDTLSMEQALSNKSEFLASQGFHDLAADAQYECLELIDRFGPPDYLAPVNYSLASNYSEVGRTDDALDRYVKAERYARTYGMPALWSMAQAGRAEILARSTRPDRHTRARAALDSAIIDVRATGSPKYEAQVEHIYGVVEHLAAQPDSAKAHLVRASILFALASDALGLAGTQLVIGDLMAEARRWAEAGTQISAAMTTARAARLRPTLAHALELKSTMLERLGDLRGSLFYLREAHLLRDSLRNDFKTRSIAEREARYANDKRAYADSLSHAAEIREKDLIATRAQLGEAQANNRTLLIGSLALLLLGGGYAFYRNRQQRVRSEAALAIAQANERLAQEKLRTSEFQNKALRAQMEPHFIRNTIGLAIARLRKKSGTSVDDASELLASFSEWIDRVLVTSQHAAHALADELSALGNYLDLQRLRMNNSFNYTVHVDPAIDLRLAQVPPMLLQPLLENAIEYGLEPQEGRGNLRLSAERKDGGLVLSVEDDGVGRNHPKPERPRTRSASISTANIREQLAQLSERTGKPAEMRIIDLPKGTRVEVLLPM